MTTTETLASEYDEYLAEGRIWGLVDRERIKKIKFDRVPKEVVDRYLAIEDLTTSVSDVLDSLGIIGAVPASFLKPLAPGQQIVGPAVTIRNLVERKTRPRVMWTRTSFACPRATSTTWPRQATSW